MNPRHHEFHSGAPPPKGLQVQTWEEGARRIRRRLSRYSVSSIVEASLSILDHWRGKGFEELQSAPWLTLLIVKIALEDNNIDIENGEICPIDVLDELRNMVWGIPKFDDPEEKPAAFLMIRSLLHTQLLLQQPESRAFLRWPALIAELPQEHETHKQFQATFGMTPYTWSGLAYATLAAALQGKTYIAPGWFDPLRAAYGAAVDIFLDSVSRDIPALRQELRNELHQRLYVFKDGVKQMRKNGVARPRSEVHEFPWLSRYPLLKHRSGNFAIWHRLVLARGIEQSIHLRLSDLGQAYTDAFSKVFEAHVLGLAHWSGLPVIDEAAYQVAGNKSLKSVDAIIPLGKANILIESKMSLFQDQVVLSDKAREVFMKLKRVREAILQGWEVGEMLRNGTVALAECAHAPEDFLLVVTSRQLNLGSGEHLKQMFGDDVVNRLNPEARVDAPTAAQFARLPPKNIFILDIVEFEHLAGAVQAGDVDLLELLSTAAATCRDPAQSTLHFDQLLQPHCKKWHASPLMAKARERVEGDLTRMLTDPA